MRWLLLLFIWVPICFLAAPSQPKAEDPPVPPEVALAGATLAPLGSPANQPWLTLGLLAYAENLDAHFPAELRTLPLYPPTGDLLSSVPWFSLGLTRLDDVERLIVLDPMAFVEKCQNRYDESVHGYTCTFFKHEVVRLSKTSSKQRAPETIAVCFREEPRYSVYFKWVKGGEPIPRRTLYVAGQNQGKLVLPLPEPFNLQDPEGTEAKKRSRYPITQFGMRMGMQHLFESWRGSQLAHVNLSVRYLGKQTPPDDDQLGYKIESIREEPEPLDGVTRADLYVSVKDLLLIRSELYAKNPGGDDERRIAIYHFKDIKLNPEFDAGQFDPEILESN